MKPKYKITYETPYITPRYIVHKKTLFGWNELNYFHTLDKAEEYINDHKKDFLVKYM